MFRRNYFEFLLLNIFRRYSWMFCSMCIRFYVKLNQTVGRSLSVLIHYFECSFSACRGVHVQEFVNMLSTRWTRDWTLSLDCQKCVFVIFYLSVYEEKLSDCALFMVTLPLECWCNYYRLPLSLDQITCCRNVPLERSFILNKVLLYFSMKWEC